MRVFGSHCRQRCTARTIREIRALLRSMSVGLNNVTRRFVTLSALGAWALINSSAFGAPQPPASQAAAPLPFVSPIFGDNMVLQRGKPNAIWGWSRPGDAVRVEISGKSATATAG